MWHYREVVLVLKMTQPVKKVQTTNKSKRSKWKRTVKKISPVNMAKPVKMIQPVFEMVYLNKMD